MTTQKMTKGDAGNTVWEILDIVKDELMDEAIDLSKIYMGNGFSALEYMMLDIKRLKKSTEQLTKTLLKLEAFVKNEANIQGIKVIT